MKQEQRRTPRKELQSSAVVTIDGRPLNVRTMDVSPGGLSINTSRQLAVGKNCHLRFDIPAGDGMQVVAASAHVVYCFFTGDSGYKIGLQFITVYVDGAERIAEYVYG